MKELLSVSPDDIELIASSEMFDGEWYVQKYPDVSLIGLEPAVHFVLLGSALGRLPSVYFDPVGYLRHYPEAEGQNPLLHYLRFGQAAGNLPLPDGLIEVSEDNDLVPPRAPSLDVKSHFPDALRRRVSVFKDIPWPKDAGADYRDVRAHFDSAHYVTKHYDMAQTSNHFDLVRHFMRAGDKEGRSPNPHFSSRAYRRRYGASLKNETNLFHHWLMTGRREGMIAHPLPQFEEVAAVLGMDPADCQDKLIARKNDLRARLEFGGLGEMVNKAAEIEPLISKTWRQAMQPNVQPFHQEESAQRLVAIHALQEAAEFRRAKAVVCVDGPRWGSNRRLEGHVTHALAAEYGAENIIFIGLDREGEMPKHKYPKGVRCIDGASVTMPLKEDQRQRVVLEFLRSLRADAVFNVNSGLLWNMQSEFGPIMKNDVPVVGCFFCNDKSVYGTWGGYPATQFYRQFANMKAVCTDSHFLRDDLIRQFYVPEDQQSALHVLEAPVNPDLARAPIEAPKNARPQLFWASRMDQQKRLDVVYEVARQMPHVDIRMWGQAVANGPDLKKDRPENVILEGAYARFDELPLDQADAWLYTSEWDGVPSILLEVAMTGLPIVGSLVGGTGEVLREGLSWPVSPCDNVQGYVDAIETILADPVDAREMARQLRDDLAQERTGAHYQKQVRAIVEGASS